MLAVTTLIDQVYDGSLFGHRASADQRRLARSSPRSRAAVIGAIALICGTPFELSPPVPLVIDVIAAGCAVASFGTFFSMPWRLLAFPIAAGMLAHAARWALISVAGGSAPTGALVACMLVSIVATPVVDRLHLSLCVVATPVVDRLHLPFAAVAFSAVVSLMPGLLFLFNAATGLVELVSIGPSAPAALLTSIVTSGATAFLIIMAMTFGLILALRWRRRFQGASSSYLWSTTNTFAKVIYCW